MRVLGIIRNRIKSVPMRVSTFILAAWVGWLFTTAAAGPRELLKKPESWFSSEDARRAARNLLSFQSELGGWPKNQSTTETNFLGQPSALKPTFDNGATTDELRFLARIHRATKDPLYREAFLRGLDYILAAQYENGGWPQSHPPGTGYSKHITFNDDAMVRLMQFAREVGRSEPYDFVDPKRRAGALAAFDRGVGCILKCQIRVDGTLTAWCAQHDATDFKPQPARTFELASISGAESVGITRLLMTIEKPTEEVRRAVESAVAWFERSRLKGIRVDLANDDRAPKGLNKVVVSDPSAPDLWARFYGIGSNQPLFADRDGIARSALADIGFERRNGYAWYGTWPKTLLEKEYPEWKRRLGKL